MSGDRLAQAVIWLVIAVLAWLLMLRAMTKPGAQRDPWTWVQILSSLATIGYVLYQSMIADTILNQVIFGSLLLAIFVLRGRRG
jgi:hypothetical protein